MFGASETVPAVHTRDSHTTRGSTYRAYLSRTSIHQPGDAARTLQMSLVSNAIEAMGSQGGATNTCRKDGDKSPKSVPWWASVKDWWGTPSVLQRATEKSVNSPGFAATRIKNVQIEYDLFRAILSTDIYIEPVAGPAHTGDPISSEGSEGSEGFGAATSEKGKSRIRARFIDTVLPKSGACNSCFIHELELVNATDLSRPQKHIVIVHGYMAAMGYFLKNVEAVAKSWPNLVVHVIDMPGFGNSARPEFPKSLLKLPPSASKAAEISQIIGVENWFIDKIEEWRIEKGISHFDLVGHSMGAYISSCYLLKYNRGDMQDRVVDKFMLVSPMGTESSDVSLINHAKLQFNHHDVASDPLEEIFASQDFQDGGAKNEMFHIWERLGKPRFPRNAVLKALWNNNMSPFQLLQYFGPAYSKLLSFWSFQRFQNLTANDGSEKDAGNAELVLKLHQYSFSIFNQYQASGELAITKLINHEIVPRIPLCDRGFVEYLNDAGIKTLWMYGDKDWMNSKGGEYCVEKLQGLSSPAVEYVVVKNAGHHIYLDNPEEFNKAVVGFFGYTAK